MMKKKIANIVFYQFFGSADPEKKACIFYDDGTFENVSFSEGIDACEVIVKERNIKTKDAFREMINNDLVHVVSGATFEKNFSKYFPREEKLEEYEEAKEDKDELEVNPFIPAAAATAAVAGASAIKSEKDEEENEEIIEEAKEEKAEKEEKEEKPVDIAEDTESIEDKDELVKEEKPKGFFARAWEKIKNSKIVKRIVVCATAIAIGLGLYSCANKKTLEGRMNRSNLTTISDQNIDPKETEIYDERGNQTNNHSPLLRDSNDYYDGYTFEQLQDVTLNKFQKEAMKNLHDALYGYNDTFASAYLEEGKNIRAALKFDEVVALQTAYNDYSKEQIKRYFNGAEINARDLSRAYRDAVLQLMGAHVIETKEHPVDMSMLIDSQEGKDFYNKYHRVFLEAKSLEGDAQLAKVKEFYDMLRKDFKLDEKARRDGISHSELYSDLKPYQMSIVPMVAAGEIMWNGLRIDYTLNDQETEIFNNIGLCNYADSIFRKIEEITLCNCGECDKNPLYEQYRDAMIKELKEKGIYYIDDEHRDLSKLDRFQDLVNKNRKKYKRYGSGYWVTYSWTETETRTETETSTREEITRTEKEITEEAKKEIDEQIEKENEEAKKKGEEEAAKVAEEMQKEEDAKAEKIEQEVKQEEENFQELIDQANEQIDENHSDNNPANDDPVNESDFGDYNVEFYDEYKDESGNLDSSVENITTDPTGDMTNEPLPDPNETGKAFDAQAEASYTAQAAENTVTSFTDVTPVQENTVTDVTPVQETSGYDNPVTSVDTPSTGETTYESTSEGWIESTPVSDDYYSESYWVEEAPVFEAPAAPAVEAAPVVEAAPSYEAAVDSYVEAMAAEPASVEESVEYTK